LPPPAAAASSWPPTSASPAAAAPIVAAAYAAFGRADILVNNAGIIRRANLLKFSETDWSDVLDVNLTGAFRLASASRQLVARQSAGKIINIASMLSFQGGVRVPSYTAAKSALAGLTRAMANELAPSGINVNAIAPGYMATDNTAALQADPTCATGPSSTASRPAAGARPRTWPVPRSSWPRRPPTTCRATSSRWTAAGSCGEPHPFVILNAVKNPSTWPLADIVMDASLRSA
jgi:NAD(P)-dependent dehydrogenase (short-subunit alcohol dehydrogenase family)